VFFYPAALVGPTFSFNDYMAFINREDDYEDIPSSIVPTVKCFSTALVSAFVVLVYGPTYNHLALLSPAVYTLSFLQKCLLIFKCALVGRTTYYCAWKLSETACILSGLGYNGNGKWDRLENVNVYAVETAENPRALLTHWNKNTVHSTNSGFMAERRCISATAGSPSPFVVRIDSHRVR
jgi:lysophospholipid acyltransferase